MARVSTYLNFPRSTEDAFLFYKSVFGTEFTQPIHRFKDIAPPRAPRADVEVDRQHEPVVCRM
jgi:PhnB protein